MKLAVSLALATAGCFVDPGPPSGAVPSTGWTLVEFESATTGTRVPLMPTKPGDLIIVAAEVADGLETFQAGSDLMPVLGSVTSCTNTTLEVFFGVPDVGVNVVTATVAPFDWLVWVFSGLPGPVLDDARQQPSMSSSGLAMSPIVTPNQDGDVVVAAAVAYGDNITDPSVSDLRFVHDAIVKGNGFAHVNSNQTPAGMKLQAQWDLASGGSYCSAAVAFRAGQ
jgi:hypothetical protein